jgi:hypothetical protein
LDAAPAGRKARHPGFEKNAALQYAPAIPICTGEGAMMSKSLTLAAALSVTASALVALLTVPGVIA